MRKTKPEFEEDDEDLQRMEKLVAKNRRMALVTFAVTTAIVVGATFIRFNSASITPKKMQKTADYLGTTVSTDIGHLTSPRNLYKTLPIYIHVSKDFSNEEMKKIQSACDAWNKVFERIDADQRFEISTDGSRGMFDVGNIFIGKKEIEDRVAGNATPSYDLSRLNKTIEKGWIFLDDKKIASIDGDLEDVLIHELGHLIGLGHSKDPYSFMYEFCVDYQNLDYFLSPDDMKKVAALLTSNTSEKNLSKIKASIEEYQIEYEKQKQSPSILVIEDKGGVVITFGKDSPELGY